jgi:uncharacterized membrane protein
VARSVKTDLGTLGGPNSTPSIFMVNSSVNQKGEIRSQLGRNRIFATWPRK